MTSRANYKAWRELGASRRRSLWRAWQSVRDRRALRRARRKTFAGPVERTLAAEGASHRSAAPAGEYRTYRAQRDVYRSGRWR